MLGSLSIASEFVVLDPNKPAPVSLTVLNLSVYQTLPVCWWLSRSTHILDSVRQWIVHQSCTFLGLNLSSLLLSSPIAGDLSKPIFPISSWALFVGVSTTRWRSNMTSFTIPSKRKLRWTLVVNYFRDIKTQWVRSASVKVAILNIW